MKLEYEHILRKQNSSFYVTSFVGESFECPYHIHNEYEIVIISKGKGRIVVGDYTNRYEPFSLYLFGPNLPHTFFSDPPIPNKESKSESHYAQFKIDCFGIKFFNTYEMKGLKKLLDESNRGLMFSGFDYNRIKYLFNIMEECQSMEKLSTFIEVLTLITKSVSYTQLATEQYTRVSSHFENNRLNRSIDIINRNFSNQLTLEDVASEANLSQAAFSRFFKHHMNQSFIDYLIELRLSEACRLLLETDLPITDISHDVGFKNLSNFNRQFLKRKLMSPRKFRKSLH